MPDDVRRLVVAARLVWEQCEFDVIPYAARLKELDEALEAFSSRVPYDDEPALNPADAEGVDSAEDDLRKQVRELQDQLNWMKLQMQDRLPTDSR